MKKIAILAIVVVSMFVASSAMADSFDVTNNFGIRVTEMGSCERIGATTLAPSDPLVDVWGVGTVITVELLGNATICGTVSTGATYDTGVVAALGAGDYDVEATDGADFFTITITVASVAGETIVYGGVGSEICFDLSGTTYNSQDPNNQLVKVSYRDDAGNTYSGDIYVATVKPQAHVAAICSKTVVGDGGTLAAINDFPNGLANWGDAADPENILKTGLPEVELCFTGSVNQAQVVTSCGAAFADTPACITVDDPSNTFDGTNYAFRFSTTKPGVGIASVQIYDTAGNLLAPGATTYYDANGVLLAPVPNPAVAADAVLIKELRIATAAVPAGGLVAVINYAYDTCTAAAGNADVTVAFNKVPCGDSFTATMDVITFSACSVGVTPTTTYSALFPYLPNTNSSWWAGLAFSNLATSAASINVMIVEADGDTYTATVTVPASGIVAGIITGNTMMDGMTTVATFTTTGTDSTLGDERMRVTATATGTSFNGFAMLGDGTQAQGYLPVMTTY
jgi:hypothetical protein